MSEKTEQPSEGKKKISLEEMIKQKLANKKQASVPGLSKTGSMNTNQKMKSQQTKKANNQRRRTGV